MMSLLSIFGLAGFSPLAGFKKTVLKNGMTVYVKEDHKLPLVTVQLWIRAGSIDETTKTNGISHILEHMLFKGTEKYPLGEISRVVESYGGYINAATSKEFTYYYIDIPTEGFEDALSIICELAGQKATFPPEELDRELKVILEEIKRSQDHPDHVMFENFNKQLYSQTPYKWEIIGTNETVSNMTREEIIAYYKKFYVPNNMYLLIAGDVKAPAVKKTVTKSFGTFISSGVTKRTDLIETPKAPVTERIKKDVQHAYFITGFLGPELEQEKYQYAGDILSIILGSGRSSRLNRNLYEEKQLVYTVGCSYYTQLGSGMFLVSALCETKNVEKVQQEISNELNKVINEKITPQEIEKAKELIKSSWYYQFETINNQAQTLGYWLIVNKLDFLENYITNIDKVTHKDMKKFLTVYYTGLTTTVVEPEEK